MTIVLSWWMAPALGWLIMFTLGWRDVWSYVSDSFWPGWVILGVVPSALMFLSGWLA